MDNKNYKVVIFSTPGVSHNTIEKLASLFRVSHDQATMMLQRDEFTISKKVDKKTAEKFHRAITQIGINCRIDNAPEEETALPTLEDIPVPQHQNTNDSLLNNGVRRPGSEQSIRNLKLQPLGEVADANPDYYCPDCGAIRASSEEVCRHCGFDPAKSGRRRRFTWSIRLVVATFLISVVALLASPFVMSFIKRYQVQEDLKLAFEMRNRVTEFIERTRFWPNQNLDAGLPKQISNRSIESIIVGKNGVMTVTLRAEALEGEAQTLILKPRTMQGQVVWNCQEGTLSEKYRPELCQSHIIR